MSIIYFRVDSSDEIGGGHISRCLSLAKILRETNLVKFICENYFNVLHKNVTDNGIYYGYLSSALCELLHHYKLNLIFYLTFY